MHASHRPALEQQKRVQRRAQETDSYAFFNLLTGPQMLDGVEKQLPPHRERLFPPTETLSMFLAQVLSPDGSCQQAVNDAALKRLVHGLPCCSSKTSAYCQARGRLPTEMICALTRQVGGMIARSAPSWWHWQVRPVRLVDGATVTLADTEENQAAYPQPSSQKPGLGFPICRTVAMICLGSGAVLDAATGPCEGKGSDEQTLLRGMLDTLEADDILLGDAFYPTYFLLCDLVQRGIDGVFEQYGARKRSTDFRTGKRLGARDHLIVLDKPKKKPDWMTPEAYDQALVPFEPGPFSGGNRAAPAYRCCQCLWANQFQAKQKANSRWRFLPRDPPRSGGRGLPAGALSAAARRPRRPWRPAPA